MRNIIQSLTVIGLFLGNGAIVGAQTIYSLDQCKQLALQNNISICEADSKIEQAKQQEKEVFTKFFPKIGVAGFVAKSNKHLIDYDIDAASYIPSELKSAFLESLLQSIPTTINISMFDRLSSVNISAIQPVFMGGRIFNGHKLTKLGIEASTIQKELSERQVEKQIEEYYWQLVQLNEKMNTIKVLQARVNTLLHDVTAAVKAGLKERNDLLQVQLKQNELDKSEAELLNGISLLKMLMAQYMGIKDSEYDIIGINDTTNIVITGLKQDHLAALQTLPEYRLLQKQVEQKRLERKMAVGANAPEVAVGATYGYMKTAEMKANGNGIIFATASIPISDWWGGSHTIKRKQVAEDYAKQQLESDSERLIILMQKNWNDVTTAQTQLQISKKSIEQSQENLRLNQVYYKAGTNTISDLLEAQQLYQQARDNYVKDFTDLQLKILAYEQSVGLK